MWGPQTLKNLEIFEGADGSGSAVKRLVARPGSSALIGAAVRTVGVRWVIRGKDTERRCWAAVGKALEDSGAARR